MTPYEINETAYVAITAALKVNFHITQGSKTTDALLATTQSVADSAIQHDSGKDFFLHVRIEGKDKVKRIMIPSIEIGTYDDLVDIIRERYLSDDANAGDYAIKIKDVDGELNWSMDIETTADLMNAFKYNSPNAKMKKMLALVSNPQDPLADDQDHDFLPSFLCTNDGNSFASASPAEGSRTGEKRKIVAAAPVKKSPKKPRSKSKSSSDGRKLPVRTKIIQALAELHSLSSVKPPRVEVAMFAGYSNDKSKGFTNPLSALSREGMAMYPDSKSVALTAKGEASEEAQGITPPRNNNEVHSRIKSRLISLRSCRIETCKNATS